MQEEVLGLGQRTGTMILNSHWTQEENDLLEKSGLTQADVIAYWVKNGGAGTLNVAMGDCKEVHPEGTTAPVLPEQLPVADAPIENVNELSTPVVSVDPEVSPVTTE